MNKSTKKLVAIVLMISMLFTLAPASVFAAPADSHVELNGLKQYTSMEQLIQDAIDELVAQGNAATVVEADETLVEDVEEASGKTFGEVKSSIAQGLFAEYEQGSLDVAELNLHEDEMHDVMDVLLKERYMANAVDYQFNTRNGIVTDIDFNLSDALQAVLGELSSMTEEVAADEEFQQAVALVAADVVVEEPEPQVGLFGLRAAEEEATTPQMFSWCACPQSSVTTNTAIQFTWEETSTYVLDEEGNPTYGLMYDAENDAITFGPVLQWDAQAVKAEYDCPVCGQHCVVEGDLAPYIITTDLQDYVVQTGPEESMTFMQFRVAVLGVPVFEEGQFGVTAKDAEGKDCIASNQDFYNGTNGGALYDVSSLRTKYAFMEMTALNNGKSECFGIANPFWTSKNTATNPLGGLKVVLNMEETDPDVPALFAQYIPQLTQGYAALVYYYEGALLDIANAAREVVNVGTAYDANKHITTEYKLLLLHDWLANNAIFDMGSLLASREDGGQNAGDGGSVGLESLLGMTPFTLLSDAIGYNGGVCLGYAASYSYIVQNAFSDNYYVLKDGATGTTMADYVPKDNPEHMVDFVKIRFNSNVAESSVAGGNSGFEGRFNEPHFFNAVKVDNNWYYVDACYDDVNSEVISQHRVETEGNISHMYFLNSPETIEDQFDGNCDYIDSLYDGVDYVLPIKDKETGERYTAEEYQAEVEADKREAGWDTEKNPDETRYTDTTYEEAWFANAESEIILHEGNWYYVEGLNAYNSMKDMMDDMDDSQMEQMKDQMQGQMNDPQYAHELKRRPISANGDLTGTATSGQGQNMTLSEDKHAYGLYHYGYGYFDYEPGGVDENSGYEAVFAADLEDDRAYRQMYPELSHGLGIYNGKLYFNISNKILCCNLALIGSDEVPITQVKEYNDVYAVKDDNKLFEGMGFTLTDDKDAKYSFRYRPLAGLSIHNKIVPVAGTDQMGETVVQAVDMVPTMYVAVGTNLTESYGDPNYTTEALNYNPNYQRFMDDDKTDGENTNVEFMWCANLTEEMDMATLLSELTGGETEEVAVAAYCEKDAFTEQRTVNYGLSDGSTKTVSKNTALKHSYEWNETEQVYVCKNCNHCTAERPSVLVGDINGDGKVSAKDYKQLKKAILEGTTSSLDVQYADINGDGMVSAKDYKQLKKQILSA